MVSSSFVLFLIGLLSQSIDIGVYVGGLMLVFFGGSRLVGGRNMPGTSRPDFFHVFFLIFMVQKCRFREWPILSTLGYDIQHSGNVAGSDLPRTFQQENHKSEAF